MDSTSSSNGALVGYARVSTASQGLSLQMDALEEAGCIKIFTDVAAGARSDRPGLAEAIAYMRPGDQLVAWKLDRIARSTGHLVSLMEEFKVQGFGFKSLTEQIDTSTAMGECIFTIMAAIAALEKSLIVERSRAGLEAARARGAKPGRKPALTEAQIKVVRELHAAGELTMKEISDVVGASRATCYRALPQLTA